jgi:hypothetical protein
MITKAQLSEGLLHKTIFECLAENDQSEIIDIYIDSINKELDLDVERKITILLEQFCKYSFWCERTIGSLFRDFAVILLIDDLNNGDATKYYNQNYRACLKKVNEIGRKNLENYSNYEELDYGFDEVADIYANAFMLIEDLDFDNRQIGRKKYPDKELQIIFCKVLYIIIVGKIWDQNFDEGCYDLMKSIFDELNQ